MQIVAITTTWAFSGCNSKGFRNNRNTLDRTPNAFSTAPRAPHFEHVCHHYERIDTDTLDDIQPIGFQSTQ